MTKAYCSALFALLLLPLVMPAAEIVTFPSGEITLPGVLYRPEGTGPFPAVIYNHGSAPGMMSEQAFTALGPEFVAHGWVFFGPYRRGQGLSASAGPYIGDQIAAGEKKGGIHPRTGVRPRRIRLPCNGPRSPQRAAERGSTLESVHDGSWKTWSDGESLDRS